MGETTGSGEDGDHQVEVAPVDDVDSRETIAYCPDCKKELNDFDLVTSGYGRGRCRCCDSVAWMGFEAQELIQRDDCVTLATFRAKKEAQNAD